MDLVTGAMGSLIPKLLKILGDEYKLQTGTKKEVQDLARELESIYAFLCKVSDVPWDQLDDQDKVWAREAREASYDMEDILDTFLVRIEGREPNDNPSKFKRTMKKLGNLFSVLKDRHNVGSAIKDIRSRLQELAERRSRYRIHDIVVNPATIASTVDPRLQAMYKEVANLVGLDKPRDDLISKLSSQAVTSSRKIVAIVGMGGLGKTTLAKGVYDKIRVDFECAAFVPVGRNPNLSKVLMDILYDLDKKRFEDIHAKNRGERLLIDNLREFLFDKRYFIVIDDIWENKSWIEAIELALLENNRGSRIIVTTRNTQVAENISDEVYKMPPLSDDNSKKLFYTRIFGDEVKWPQKEPDEIPNKILCKCDGVPLAIITMASLLVGKPRERWSDVFTSVGFGHKDDRQVEITMKILSFSYYDMPSYLRTCLLYLSVFPEDSMIDQNSLIWRWIAEGFIQAKPGIRLFELGEQYLNDLVNRSMIQAIEPGWLDKVVYCRVHDMVLDLIRSISSEENFVTISDNDEGTASSPPPRTARRLAFHGNTMNHTAHGNTVDMAKVRSFGSFGCDFGNWTPLSSCKLLRVLDLAGCNNLRPCHLVHLGNLLHLRYLGLVNCPLITDLPNEIGGLKFLQTLNMESTKEIQLTPTISGLTQLVCLKFGQFTSVTLAPNWIGKLTSIEQLQINIDHVIGSNKEDHARGFLKALGSLRELRVFQCSMHCSLLIGMDGSMQRDLLLSLRNLHKLVKLNLDFPMEAETALWGEQDFVFPRHLQVLRLNLVSFSCLPPCIGAACLPNLTHLSLIVYNIDHKDLEFLGKLPELRYLYLITDSTITIRNISASDVYFPKLRMCRTDFSMIQIRCEEGDSSVSFHIWNGRRDAMPFGFRKKSRSIAPYGVMPNLEELSCQIFMRDLKYSKVEYGDIVGLDYLPSLEKVTLAIDCAGASAAEADVAKAALRKATEVHPNRPTLEMFICDDGTASETERWFANLH